MCLLGMILGSIVTYILGTIWLAYLTKMPFNSALSVAVIPFLPGDLIKMILAALIGPQIRKRLITAGLYA